MEKDTDHFQIICPHCGWVVKNKYLAELKKVSLTNVFQSGGKKKQGKKILKNQDEELRDANAWIDMPPCPKCKEVYQFNLNNGETRP